MFDRDAALSHLGGDGEILAELLGMFREQGPERLERVEGALAAGDAGVLEREAHALKGAAATLGMGQLTEAAHRVERLAAQGSQAGAAEAVARLREAVAAVLEALPR